MEERVGKRTVRFESILSFFEISIIGERERDSSVCGIDEWFIVIEGIGKTL